MAEIRAMVPHFHELKTDQSWFIRNVGYPSDLMPVSRTPFGQSLLGRSQRRFVDWPTCCNTNIWQPLVETSKHLGATTIYRGQKKADLMHVRVESGQTEDGITYVFPLEDWTDADVFAFLGDKVPEHYLRGEKTSQDCVNCTAYLHENTERIAALPSKDRAEIIEVLRDLRGCIQESVDYIDGIVGESNAIVR